MGDRDGYFAPLQGCHRRASRLINPGAPFGPGVPVGLGVWLGFCGVQLGVQVP